MACTQAIGFIFPIHWSEQINFVNLWLVHKPSDLSFRFTKKSVNPKNLDLRFHYSIPCYSITTKINFQGKYLYINPLKSFSSLCGYFTFGNFNTIVVPCPNWLTTSMLPLWASIISFAIDSPSPLPPIERLLALSTL